MGVTDFELSELSTVYYTILKPKAQSPIFSTICWAQYFESDKTFHVYS